jgi:hypothetical protein
LRRVLPITLTLMILAAACGPGGTPPPRRGSTAARRAAPARCPTLELSPKLRRQKKLTRRIRNQVCALQECYDAAKGALKEPGGTVRLSVTIDTGGRIEAIRLSSRKLPPSLTGCVRAKVLRWDFDIRDDSFTYGPFTVKFAP